MIYLVFNSELLIILTLLDTAHFLYNKLVRVFLIQKILILYSLQNPFLSDFMT